MHSLLKLCLCSILVCIVLANTDIEEFCKGKPKNQQTLSCSPFNETQKIFCPSGEVYDCPPIAKLSRPATRDICQALGPEEAPRCLPDLNTTAAEWCKKEHPGQTGFYCNEVVKTIRIQCPQGWIYKCPQIDNNLDPDMYPMLVNYCNQTYPDYATCEQMPPGRCLQKF